MKFVNTVVFTGLMLSAGAYAASACHAGNISLKLDDRNGEFDGMSQSGTVLVVRNTSNVTCMFGVLPKVTFVDASDHPLSTERRISKWMHPGPVLIPVQLDAGKEAESRLHWVASNVFDSGHCIRPARLLLRLEEQSLYAPFGRMMCVPKGSNAFFDQQPFHLVN